MKGGVGVRGHGGGGGSGNLGVKRAEVQKVCLCKVFLSGCERLQLKIACRLRGC